MKLNLDLKKIMSKDKKQQTGENLEIQEKKACLTDYLQRLPVEINLRLLYETMPEELIGGRVLWVEKIIVTGADFGIGQKRKFLYGFRFFRHKIFKRTKG